MLSSKEVIDSPINLGNPNEFSMMELAHTVLNLTGSKSKIVYKDLPLDDPRQRKPDITRAKEVLKWAPKIELEQGVSQTIDYFKSVLN